MKLSDKKSVVELFYKLKPFVTDSIWLGAMNKIEQRVDTSGWTGDKFSIYLARVKLAKHPEIVRGYYFQLKDEPLVRWKDSFKSILGLESPKEIGKDI